MKRVIYCLLFSCVTHFVHGQIAFERQVFASAGTTASVGNSKLTFSYTIGEAVASTASSGNTYYTQGFQQPQNGFIKAKDRPFDMDYTIYPNPAADQVNIDIRALGSTDAIVLKMYAMDGRLVQYGTTTIVGNSTITLDVSSLPRAVYVLSLYNRTAKAFATELIRVAP